MDHSVFRTAAAVVILVGCVARAAKSISGRTVVTRGTTAWIFSDNTPEGVDRMSALFGEDRKTTALGVAATGCSVALKLGSAVTTFKLVGAYDAERMAVVTGGRAEMQRLCSTPNGPELVALQGRLGQLVPRGRVPRG